MATVNWCYGAKTPDVEQAVSDAIFAAHRYRNRLCELELAKRARHYELLREIAPAFVAAESRVAVLETELGNIREAIQSERVKQRTKSPKGVQSIVSRAAQLKAEIKEARVDLKLAKLDAYQDHAVIAAMADNAAKHKDDCAEAKSSSGLYWGTEAIVRQACGSFASGAPPRFKRYDGEGQLAVQLQGGLGCQDAERSNTLCYLGESLGGKRRECFIRIGSDGRKPVFAMVPIVFHRQLPQGKIKWAYLERRKIADHVRWTVRLTIDIERELEPTLPGEVAIHTGWRMEETGLRAATWLGSDGSRGVLRLPKSHCDDYYRVDEVRSKRDAAFNEMIGELREWLKGRELPEWLADARSHLHAWKAKQRLAKLWWTWMENRFDGDDCMFERLNQWRKSDKHLWQHERRLSVRIVRRRKDVFRNFAAMLSGRYGVAIVSPIDAKELTENTSPEELERDNTQAHRHGKWAAVSELTQMLREKFPLRCVEVEPRNITRQCCNCGAFNEVTHRKIQCCGCGQAIDRDDNAVINTLARGEAAIKSGSLIDLETAERDKAVAAKEKLAKMQQAARNKRAARKCDQGVAVLSVGN